MEKPGAVRRPYSPFFKMSRPQADTLSESFMAKPKYLPHKLESLTVASSLRARTSGLFYHHIVHGDGSVADCDGLDAGVS